MSAPKLRAVVATWRPDIVRPNLQLSTFLNSLADHPKLTPQAVKAAESLRNNTAFKKVRNISTSYSYGNSTRNL